MARSAFRKLGGKFPSSEDEPRSFRASGTEKAGSRCSGTRFHLNAGLDCLLKQVCPTSETCSGLLSIGFISMANSSLC
jgi:hypothetical protein